MSAVEYAEQTLKVHALWDEAQKAQADLDNLASELDKAQDQKRALAEKILDRETELLEEEQGKHEKQSATWLKEHMVVQKRKDPVLKDLREKHFAEASTLSGLEYDWDVKKTQCRLLEARLLQMGGYLNFLAAAKQAENITKTHNTTETQG